MSEDHNETDTNSRDHGRFSIFGAIAEAKIQNKITSLVITICLFSLLSMSIAAFITINRMADYSKNINITLGNDAAEGGNDALMNQANHFLQIIAREQSQTCGNVLDTIKLDVRLLESVVRDLFINSHHYRLSRPIVKPSETVDGIYNNTYSLPGNVPMTAEIKRELDLLSNLSLLTPTLADNSNVIELYVGMESGLFYNYTKLWYEDLEYDPRVRPWYIDAVAHPGEVIFTDVYEDAFGSGMVITAAKAVFDDNGKLLGVAALDILLENLKEIILGIRVTESGHAFIINSSGKYIVHPNMGNVGFEPFISETGSSTGLSEGYKRMMNGEEGFVSDEMDGEKIFMVFSPISVADWSLGVIVYEDEILSSLGTLKTQMDGLATESEKNIISMSNQALIIFIIIFIIVAVMVAVMSVRLTHIVSRPIRKLTEEVVKVGEGNFEYRIPVESHDEIGFLTEAFNNMADNLYEYTQDIIELDRKKSELEITASTDALTGVLNRGSFIELASLQISTAVKNNTNAFITMLDLDHFKNVNDTYGHQAGDKVLKEVAATVKRSIRSSDLLARYGGEEFILLTADISKATIQALIERIRQNICKNPIEFENMQISISASFGIAPVSDNNLDEAISLPINRFTKPRVTGETELCFSIIIGYQNSQLPALPVICSMTISTTQKLPSSAFMYALPESM